MFLSVEASHLIDLKKLVGKYAPNHLTSRIRDLSVLKRFPENVTIVLFIFSSIGYLLHIQDDGIQLPKLIGLILLIFLTMRRMSIKNEYYVDSEGLIVPYSWVSRKRISFDEIVRVQMEELTSTDDQSIQRILGIVLDTPKLKFNTTGMIDTSIYLSEVDFDYQRLETFYHELQTYHRNAGVTSNTQAERLSLQASRAWNNRWKQIIFRFLDSSTEFGLFISVLILTNLLTIQSTVITLAFLAILAIYCLIVLVFLISDRPHTIIGIRPHELGPIFYNEADLVTTIRFIIISYPIGVKLENCDLIFKDDPLPQNYKLEQLHPAETEPGALSYGVAQYVGNHSKANGANITFSFVSDETEFTVPIYWS